MGADIYYLRPGQVDPDWRQYSSFDMDETADIYRDPHNSTSTVRLFGLSWMGSMTEYMDENHEITADHAEELLDDLETRRPQFEENLAALPPSEQEYHRTHLAVLVRLLNQVKRSQGARLYCSI